VKKKKNRSSPRSGERGGNDPALGGGEEGRVIVEETPASERREGGVICRQKEMEGGTPIREGASFYPPVLTRGGKGKSLAVVGGKEKGACCATAGGGEEEGLLQRKTHKKTQNKAYKKKRARVRRRIEDTSRTSPCLNAEKKKEKGDGCFSCGRRERGYIDPDWKKRKETHLRARGEERPTPREKRRFSPKRGDRDPSSTKKKGGVVWKKRSNVPPVKKKTARRRRCGRGAAHPQRGGGKGRDCIKRKVQRGRGCPFIWWREERECRPVLSEAEEMEAIACYRGGREGKEPVSESAGGERAASIREKKHASFGIKESVERKEGRDLAKGSVWPRSHITRGEKMKLSLLRKEEIQGRLCLTGKEEIKRRWGVNSPYGRAARPIRSRGGAAFALLGRERERRPVGRKKRKEKKFAIRPKLWKRTARRSHKEREVDLRAFGGKRKSGRAAVARRKKEGRHKIFHHG